MADAAGPLTAVVWDFDGTLADTRFKNLSVNRRIVHEITGRPWRQFAALETIEAYDRAVRHAANWRELYRRNFGFTDGECDRAAGVWAEYQLADSTPAPIFDGLGAVIARLADVPQGIVSQNARAHIIERLVEADLRRYFKAIVGYQELPPGTQKPDPDGLLICLEALTSFGPGTALYIGDHESDVLCAARTNEVLADRGIDLRIKTVGVFFADGSTNASWTHNPDDRARCPGEILTIAEGFPGSSISVIREANDIIEPKM